MAWTGTVTATTVGNTGVSFGFAARNFLLTHTSTAGIYLDITTTSGASTGTAYFLTPASSAGVKITFGPITSRGMIGFSLMCPQTSVGATQDAIYAAWK